MNFTTADCKRHEIAVKQKYERDPNLLLRNKELVAENKKVEYEVVTTQGTICPARNAFDYDVNQETLNYQEVNHKLGEQFYNYSTLEAAACALGAVFYGPPSAQGTATVSETIRESVTGLRQIGEESVFGYALLGNVKGVEGPFVLKTSRVPDADAEIIHEQFITTQGLNDLRKTDGVPNFAVVFGGASASRPIIGPDKKIIEWASPGAEKRYPYVIYENVSPSVSGNEYIKKCNRNKLLSVLLQQFVALEIAERKCCFAHYDAHPGNWVARAVPSLSTNGEMFQIPYTNSKGRTLYIAADCVATFIDYGRSIICYPKGSGRYFGTPDAKAEFVGAYLDKAFALADAYKSLMFTAEILLESHGEKSPEFEVCKRIFAFFNKTEPLATAVVAQREFYYFLPHTAETSRYTLSDLINHTINVCDCANIISYDFNPKLKVLQCQSCYTIDAISKDVGATRTIAIPRTFLALYDLAPLLSTKYPQHYGLIKKRFRYGEAYKQYVDTVEEITSEIARIISSLSITAISLESIANYNTLQAIKLGYVKLFSLVSLVERLTLYLKIGTWIQMNYPSPQLKALISNKNSYLTTEVKRALCESVTTAIANYAEIYKFVRSPNWNRVLRTDHRLSWYTTGASQISTLNGRACTVKVITDPSQVSTQQTAPNEIIHVYDVNSKQEQLKSKLEERKQKIATNYKKK